MFCFCHSSPSPWKRKVLDDVALDLAVVLLDEVVRFELVLDRGDVERRLAAGIGDEDDEGIFVGCSNAAHRGSASEPKMLLPEPRKPMMSNAALRVVSQGMDKLGDGTLAGVSVK